MNKFNLFLSPQKGLRYSLSRFSNLIGRTDYTKSRDLNLLKKYGEESLRLFECYFEICHKYMYPGLDGMLKSLAVAKKEEELEMLRIKDVILFHLKRLNCDSDDKQIHDFYLEFTAFQCLCLEHFFDIEKMADNNLSPLYSDSHQNLIKINIIKGLKLQDILIWIKCLVPSQNKKENILLLKDMKNLISEIMFKLVCSSLKSEIGDKEYNQLILAVR